MNDARTIQAEKLHGMSDTGMHVAHKVKKQHCHVSIYCVIYLDICLIFGMPFKGKKCKITFYHIQY